MHYYVSVFSCINESLRLHDNLSICSKQVENHFRTSFCVLFDSGATRPGVESAVLDAEGNIRERAGCNCFTVLASEEVAEAIADGSCGAYRVATTSSNATRIAWEIVGSASRAPLPV